MTPAQFIDLVLTPLAVGAVVSFVLWRIAKREGNQTLRRPVVYLGAGAAAAAIYAAIKLV